MPEVTGISDDLPGLDAMAVESWLADHVPGIVPPVTFSLIAGGHSNLTYSAADVAGRRVVIRRPPLRTGAGRANDVGREHLVIAALGPTVVPVPRALAMCTDESVIGAPFYVMEHVPGHVVDNPGVADAVFPTPGQRRRAGESIVDVLADLHGVDVDAVGLGAVARREDFLGRQLKRMHDVWHQTKTRELPLMDELHGRLVERQPPQRHTGIVHSDYRIGNVMCADSGEVVAVLDWELWTLGDVLADVGFLLNNWVEPGEDVAQVWMEVPTTTAGGFGTKADVVDRYVARTGSDLSDVGYYRAFQYWKVAVLAEGVKRRYETAAMASTDVDFRHLDRRVVDLAALAHQHLRET